MPQVHAGRINNFYNNWTLITHNKVVLSWIKDGYSIPFSQKAHQAYIPVSSFSNSESKEMTIAINKLLELGAIQQCSPCPDQFLSKIFLAPKSNGSKRFILNLKPLNKFIENSHFKMEDYRTASKLIPTNGYLATIDLKEAYLLLSMSETDRKYLRFEFNNPDIQNHKITYEFTAMPYGLCVAPRVFTKLMTEVITHLRKNGYKSVHYLDDILCIGDDYDDCLQNVNTTLDLLTKLGFVINYEKSCLQPTQSCKFLGFIFNTQDMTISLPEQKRSNLAQLLERFSKLPRCSIREFAQFIGSLIAACPAIKYGWLYTKTFEREKFLALRVHNNNYEAKINLSNNISEDILWWKNIIISAYCPMRNESHSLEIYTDASNSGWGAVCGTKKVHGLWKAAEKEYHINFLELLAIFLGLKSFACNLSNCGILLRVDNTTAISYINRMGGIQFPHLNNLARNIWQWCEIRNITLFASYVNTKENLADEGSRVTNPDIEWELCDNAFHSIVHEFGTPIVDLFASRTNAKCEYFVSWKQDPDAMTVDAFTINWKHSYFYAFPPFSLILKCLRKIIDDEATGILVFPYWPSQSWFPLLKDLLISDMIFFGPNKHLLKSHSREPHPLHVSLTLAAAKLCGRRGSAAAHHRRRSD